MSHRCVGHRREPRGHRTFAEQTSGVSKVWCELPRFSVGTVALEMGHGPHGRHGEERMMFTTETSKQLIRAEAFRVLRQIRVHVLVQRK
jgi:hypothetical protein